MSFYTILDKDALLFKMSEYISSRDIIKLFLLGKSFTIYLNISYNELICKLYGKLYFPLQIKNQLDFGTLIMTTIELIKSKNILKYINRQNTQFSENEISIRNIIYDVIKYKNITSLYYLLYVNGFYDLLNRFIVDEIVISPYECTHSNKMRKILHYYGNEQTLRMALRFKQHSMLKQILSDMRYITKKNHLGILWFMWGNNNVLYESVKNEDFDGFSIILKFIHKEKKRHDIILLKSDRDISISNDNYFGESLYRIDDADIENDEEGNNNINDGDDRIFHMEENLLTYTLITNVNRLFKDFTWHWRSYRLKLSSLDFYPFCGNTNNRYFQYGKFIISDRFREYINLQKIDIIQHLYTYNIEYLKQFRLLVSSLTTGDKIDIYSPINNNYSPNTEIYNYYLLIRLIENHDLITKGNVFIMVNLLLHYFDNFDINFKYAPRSGFYINFYYYNNDDIPEKECTLLEYIDMLIYGIYHTNKNIFISYQFKYFVNLLLIREMLSERENLIAKNIEV